MDFIHILHIILLKALEIFFIPDFFLKFLSKIPYYVSEVVFVDEVQDFLMICVLTNDENRI